MNRNRSVLTIFVVLMALAATTGCATTEEIKNGKSVARQYVDVCVNDWFQKRTPYMKKAVAFQQYDVAKKACWQQVRKMLRQQ